MKAKIKYFGMIAEKIKREEENLDLEKNINLRKYIEEKYPELNKMEYKIAINQEIREEIHEDDQELEIAILPPFAGG